MRHSLLALSRASCARVLAAALFVLLLGNAASALPLVGLTNDNRLLFFDSAHPDAILATRTVTGLQPGESLLGIDVRPATGQLYGVGSTSRLYRLNLSTGAATPVSLTPFSPALNVSPQGGFEVGFDFEPVGDRARVVANGQSLRLDPNSGTVVAVDGPLTNAPGEPEAGRTPDVTGIAYDGVQNNIGSVALYGVDWRLDRLVRINPVTGVVTTVGRLLGVAPFITETAGFDVVPGDGSRLAFAALRGTDASASRLHVVDLNAGTAYPVGQIGPANTFVRGLAALPPESNLYAVTATNKLLLFNALIPEIVLSTRQITGLGQAEKVLGIDTRSRDGRLYALGSTSRFYRLDEETGAATPVRDNPFTPALSGNEFGLSIHPLQDFAYVTSDTGQNLDADPATGFLLHNNPKLFYKTGDPNEGRSPRVTALAHLPGTPPDSGFSAFLYGIDSDRDALVTMNFPATGELTTVGPLDLVTVGDAVGFDIDWRRNVAYAALSPLCFEGCPAPTLLTTVDLRFGRATPVGFIGTSEQVRSIAVAHGSTIQFALPSLSVVEGCTTARLLVTRTGFANTAAEFGYETGAAATGAPADPRKDYTAAAARVRFEAGEAVKTVDILVSEDAHQEPAESLAVALTTTPGFFGPGSPRAATLFILDDGDTGGGPNPIDDTATFVCQHYHDFLSRTPDTGGQLFWTNNVESCGQNQQCREVRRVDTSAAFFLSIEFQETGFFVYRVYQAAFARTPVPVRFEEFQRDVRRVGEGVVVGAAGWEQRLEQNKRAFADEFVARADFRARYPGELVMTNAQYVDALNANTGNSLSAPERNALVAALNAGSVTRAAALRAVADDEDFRRRETSRAFVLMQYFGYLRRNPDDPPDADFAGYDFWLSKLNQFGGNYVAAEMVKAFISSIEYRQRFGQ